MEDDPEVLITFNEKDGEILLSGIESQLVKAAAKQLKRRRKVTIQLFPDGFIISDGGIFLSRAPNEERPAGYG
jgi:hypothetical protein